MAKLKLAPEQMGKMLRVRPEDPRYAGIYLRCHGDLDNPTGVYYINYREFGKPKFEKVGRADQFTPKQVLELRTDRIRDVKLRHATFRNIPTMEDAFVKFYTQWLATERCNDRATPLSRYNKHIAPYLQDKRLDEITDAVLNGLKPTWNKKLSPSTVNQILNLISRVYSAMKALGYYRGDNPVKETKKMKGGDIKRMKHLTIEQTKQLLEELEQLDEDTHRMAMFATYAGLRKSEILRITPGDIDMRNKTIMVRDTKDSHGRSETTIADFFSPLKVILKEMLEEHKEKGLGPADPLFKDKKFRDVVFKRAVDKLGFNKGLDSKDSINRVVFHTLRHTYASFFANAGESLALIKDKMRHRSIASTDRYSHIGNRTRKKANARVEALIFNDKKEIDNFGPLV